MNRGAVITILFLILILGLVFTYYLNVRQDYIEETTPKSTAESVLSSDVPYTDIEGQKINLLDRNKSFVIAVSWASWCPQCVEQLNILGEFSDTSEDIAILAFNRAEPVSTAKNFLEFHGLISRVELVMDPTDNFYTSIEGRVMPETVIFDSDGNTIHHERGLLTKEELQSKMLQLTQGN